MAIINFSIPKTLERRIKEITRKKGFPSKAELFRFALIRYLDEKEKRPLDDNLKISILSQKLEEELSKKVGPNPLLSIKKQMARIKSL